MMHLKYPMLSAAIVMGLGGIVAPEGLALATIELNGTLVSAHVTEDHQSSPTMIDGEWGSSACVLQPQNAGF